MKSKITCIIPVYKESTEVVTSTINDVIHGLKKAEYENYEIMIVNDGSGSAFNYSICSEIPNVTVVEYKNNKGYGGAIKTGLRKADGEWIFITDADGTYPNLQIDRFIERMDENDMIVGLRIPEKNAVPLTKGIAKGILKFLASKITGTKIPDLNSGMRLFKKELAMEYIHLFPDGFSLTSTITVASLNDKRDVEYLEIPYAKRLGSSKINPMDFVNFLILIARMLTYYKPLQVFIPSSIILLAIGVIKLTKDYLTEGAFGLGGGLLLVISFQMLLNGFLADALISYAKKK